MSHRRSGSSPLTRGKPIGLSTVHLAGGLIPAHAGKTHLAVRLASEMGGSSPLTRGKRRTWLPEGRRLGLIPAHAGKTVVPPVVGEASRAHPRSRGENRRRRGQSTWERGSSPLTRGKPCRIPHAAPRAGLIPAHAGKTEAARQAGIPTGAHPRSRGENHSRQCVGVGAMGSSPLTRGKQCKTQHMPRSPGLIPAHAGKTANSTVSSG